MSNIQQNPKPSGSLLPQTESTKPLRVRSGRGRPQTITHEELIRLTTTPRLRRIRRIHSIPNSLNAKTFNSKTTTQHHSQMSSYSLSSNGDEVSVCPDSEYRGGYTARCLWKAHSVYGYVAKHLVVMTNAIMRNLKNIGGVYVKTVKHLATSLKYERSTQIVGAKTWSPHRRQLLKYGLIREVGFNCECSRHNYILISGLRLYYA